MVESEAKELSEDQMLGAVLYGHQQQQIVIDNIASLAEEVGTAKQQYTAPVRDQALETSMKEQFGEQVADAYTITNKQERYSKLDEIKQAIIEALAGDAEAETYNDTVSELKEIYEENFYGGIWRD